jgi:hypothetical protein
LCRAFFFCSQSILGSSRSRLLRGAHAALCAAGNSGMGKYDEVGLLVSGAAAGRRAPDARALGLTHCGMMRRQVELGERGGATPGGPVTGDVYSLAEGGGVSERGEPRGAQFRGPNSGLAVHAHSVLLASSASQPRQAPPPAPASVT